VAVNAPRHTRHRARALFTVTLFAAMFGLLATFATAAQANPTPSSIVSEIDAQWQMLEPTIENYDLVHQKLQAQQATAAALEAKIEPLELQVTVQLAVVDRIAASVYKAGPTGTMSILLNANGTAEALNVLGEVDQMAANQRAQVASTVELQKEYQAKAKPVDALVASLQVQQTALDAQKNEIQKKINALDAERVKAFGTTRAAGAIRPAACPQKYTGDAGSRAALYACSQIGKAYIFDTDGPNHFDCSGLTLAAWATVGVTLPHNAYAQAHTITLISRSQLKPGDLVFYYHPISHVTIYVGNGWVVSAPQTGDVVRMKTVDDIKPAAYGRP
jgi:peptidoglycan DL-endopeptidase CwlO